MDVLHTVAQLRERLAHERSVALVPTMGNLHAGHTSLVGLAGDRGECVVATIFVNRLQFEPGGDFDRYPRTLTRDCDMLERAGCHIVFAPDEREMYPEPQQVAVTPAQVAATLEGEFRAGHFQGVTTVVAKLFNLVCPQVAVFGKKDYQQLMVIGAMVRQLAFPIEIVAGETVRDADGLAMSSRNGYLDAAQRKEAVRLYRNLGQVKARVEGGEGDVAATAKAAEQDLAAAGWTVDYVAVRRRTDLAPPSPSDRELVVLGAARLGETRLIDNLELSR
jgi:pantoate--beta-alanine ligase